MWHFRQSNNLLIFCTLVLCAGFMLQFKVLYNNHQKHLRIREIEDKMTELTENMHTVERVANTTLMLISTLKKSLRDGSQRDVVINLTECWMWYLAQIQSEKCHIYVDVL